MNELTRIHIAKVPYEIEKAAYKELVDYLRAVEKRVQADVLCEVEMRITEILASRGVNENKIIVSADIKALMTQLGSPEQFSELEDANPQSETIEPRRLMRDMRHAIVGGVGSGLGAYFSVDPILFRVTFVVLIFAGGSGIFLYGLLWFLIPAAKSDADRLRMQGKSVTLDSLTEIKETMASVTGKFEGGRVGEILIVIFRWIVGLGLLAFGLGWLTAGSAFLAILIRNPLYGIFPSQAFDYTILGIATLASFAAIGALAWSAIQFFKGTFPRTHGWHVGLGFIIVAVIGFSATVGLGISVSPELGQRYRHVVANKNINLPVFTALEISSQNPNNIRYIVTNEQPHIELPVRIDGEYTAVDSRVENGTLKLNLNEDTSKMNWFFGSQLSSVVIYGPKITEITTRGSAQVFLGSVFTQNSLDITASDQSHINYDGVNLDSAKIILKNSAQFNADTTVIKTANILIGPDAYASFAAVGTLHATTSQTCQNSQIYLTAQESTATIIQNGVEIKPQEIYDTAIPQSQCIGIQKIGSGRY